MPTVRILRRIPIPFFKILWLAKDGQRIQCGRIPKRVVCAKSGRQSKFERIPPRGLEQAQNTRQKVDVGNPTSHHPSHFPPDLQQIIDSWPYLSHEARRAILAIISAAQNAPGNNLDFARDFAAAFDRQDRQSGNRNYVSLAGLRRELPRYDQQTFDFGLNELRRSGQFGLSAAEGRHGITQEEQAAGIREAGALLLWVSRRDEAQNAPGRAVNASGSNGVKQVGVIH